MSKTVLHLVPATPFGGAQRVAIDLANAQRRAGWDARLIGWREDSRFQDACDAASVPYTTLTNLKDILRFKRSLGTKTRLHLHVPPTWVAALLWGFKGTVVLHLHVRPVLQVHAPTLRRRLDALAEKVIYHRSDLAISISDWVRQAWQTHYPSAKTPVVIVPNGVDVPKQAARTSMRSRLTIGLGCRLSDRKGIEEFLTLAAEIHKRDPSIQFQIAGDGPKRAEYEDQARQLGLGGSLTFLGFVDDMPGFWESIDLSVFTSPFEPFGLRLIEPVAHGIPVAAYLNGTGSDEIAENCRGIFSRPMNEAPTLADDILAVASDDQKYAQLTREGYEDILRRYTIDAMSAGVLNAYETLQAGHADR